MSHELIAILMFSSMMLMMVTGQRVFGAVGAVAAVAALSLWGAGGSDLPFSAAMKLMKWYPLLTLPMFIFMGYVLSESKIADDLYKMFHVWMGPIQWRPGNRHDRIDGSCFSDERSIRGRHGDRRDDSVAGTSADAATIRRMVTGVDASGFVAWHPGAAVCRAGACTR